MYDNSETLKKLPNLKYISVLGTGYNMVDVNSGKVAGAAVDVLSTEPAEMNNPLISAKNCFITPHIAWAPKEPRERLMNTAIDNLFQFIKKAPVNVV
ncbi:NAD(P)-dependent oxidoreductase [Clostridium sp.]|uniref:NAD(P)-dependent oxidoreductase n=1 Tax=Clostridium sp. TaxID=1506 RepID=UPI001A495093|nr:NAD(P)-dependent oxidoreductase [Clostridium sp.]MBK5236795.1 hypothetical protein [Clostridium sp.]